MASSQGSTTSQNGGGGGKIETSKTDRLDITVTTTKDSPPVDSAIVRRATKIHGDAFKTDPVFNFMLCDKPLVDRHAYMPTWVGALMKAGALNAAVFEEVVFTDSLSTTISFSKATTAAADANTIDDGDGDGEDDTNQDKTLVCSALWMPPDKRVDNWRTFYPSGMIGVMINVGLRGIWRVVVEYEHRADAAKKLGMKRVAEKTGLLWNSIGYWYLYFISTDPAARGRGVASAVIERMQAKLQREAQGPDGKIVPIWLEATTDSSRRLYDRVGFEEVDHWVLGKGSVDATGDPCKGGEGVRVWGMVWCPT